MNPFNSSAHRFSHRVRKRARTMSRILNRALVLLLIPLLTACGASSVEDASRSQSSISISQSQQTSSLQNESSLSSQSSQTAAADSQSEPYAPGYDFTADDIPPYTGNPVAIIHDNVPFFEENEETTQAFQHYFDLDAFGRATMSYASLGQEICRRKIAAIFRPCIRPVLKTRNIRLWKTAMCTTAAIWWLTCFPVRTPIRATSLPEPGR